MRKIIFICLLLFFTRFLFAATPTEQPLLQDGSISYIGSFRLPGVPGDDLGFTYGGMGLSVHPDGQSLYVGGHVYNSNLGRVSIPNPIGGTATLIQAPEVIPGSVGTGTTLLAGTLVYNGRLIAQKRIPYDTSGAGTTHSVGDLEIDNFVPFTRLANINSAQFANGYMGSVPTEWQELLGGPAFAGNSAMSIISLCSNGPSFFVFDPDDVGVVAPIPSTPLMYYTLENQLSDPYIANDLFSNSDEYNAGVVFPSGTRSVLFISRHGYGNPTYKIDDGCGGIHGEGAPPYRRQVTAFDANDLLAVKNGTKLPYEIQPYAWWVMPGPVDTCSKLAYSGLTYDQNTRRIYVSFGYSIPNIYVYEVTGSPAEDTIAPEVQSASIDTTGFQLTITLTESCTGSAGFALTPSGGAATLTYASGPGTSRVYTISREIQYGETITWTYTPGDIADTASNAMLADTGSVTNNVPDPGSPDPTCSDGIQNGDETGVDCGGSCTACDPPPTVAVKLTGGTLTGGTLK